ncbi:MAG: hypothetical protein H7A53_11980 [Akkermansiaceae bacterium]|nr:hypothetical protein [Akkermansiaceae bacterium]
MPQDVETRFTYGGWGFGHRAAVAGEGQAWCWAGIEIPAQSRFRNRALSAARQQK